MLQDLKCFKRDGLLRTGSDKPEEVSSPHEGFLGTVGAVHLSLSEQHIILAALLLSSYVACLLAGWGSA
jgi:hypothetical protein